MCVKFYNPLKHNNSTIFKAPLFLLFRAPEPNI